MFTSKQRPMPLASYPDGTLFTRDPGAMLFAQHRVLDELKMQDMFSSYFKYFKQYTGSQEMEPRSALSRMPLVMYDEVHMRDEYVESMLMLNRIMHPPAVGVSFPPIKTRPYQSKLCYEFALGDFHHTVTL